MDKFSEAICAFSNDIPNSRKNGYLIIGAKDNGDLSGLKVDDALLRKISSIRSDGNILPLPVMTTEKFSFEEGDQIVVEVTPSLSTPVSQLMKRLISVLNDEMTRSELMSLLNLRMRPTSRKRT